MARGGMADGEAETRTVGNSRINADGVDGVHPLSAMPSKDGLPKRELRKAKDPAARGWVSQAARAAGAAGDFVRPSIQVSEPIINRVVT